MSGDTILRSFWVGWAMSLGFLQVWNLWFASNALVFVPLIVLGVFGLWRADTPLFNSVWQAARRSALLFVLIAAQIVWLANRVSGPIVDYDTGLYHLQAMQWAQTYPIVPGLGNLHGRLAFNNSIFLFIAPFNSGTLSNFGYHLPTGLLMAVLFSEVLLSFRRLLTDRGALRPVHLFYCLALAPLLLKAYELPTISPDMVVFLLGFVVTGRLLRLLLTPHHAPFWPRGDLFAVVILAAAGTTVKLSFAVFGVTACVVAVAAVWWRYRGQMQSLPKTFAAALLAGLLLIAPWFVRGVILSGYPLYPFPMVAFNVDWRMPQELVIDELNWIRSWARQDDKYWGEVLANNDWIGYWLRQFPEEETRALHLALIGLVFLAAVPAQQQRGIGSIALALLPTWIGLIYWFISAPAPRFAGAGFWLLASGMWLLAVQRLNGAKRLRRLSIGLEFVLLLSFFLYIVPSDKELLVPPAPDGAAVHRTFTRNIITAETSSGLTVAVPQGDPRCWDAAIPCTAYYRDGLYAREEGNLAAGFALDRSQVYPLDPQPAGFTTPDELYAQLGVGWHEYNAENGSRMMAGTASVWIYSARATPIQFNFRIGDPGAAWNPAIPLEAVSLAIGGPHQSDVVVPVTADRSVRLPLQLQPGLNRISLQINVAPRFAPMAAALLNNQAVPLLAIGPFHIEPLRPE